MRTIFPPTVQVAPGDCEDSWRAVCPAPGCDWQIAVPSQGDARVWGMWHDERCAHRGAGAAARGAGLALLVAGHLVGWVRPHRAGWTAVVAGAAPYVPPTVGLAQAVERLLRHRERGGSVLLEHLSPASATRLLVQLGAIEEHRRVVGCPFAQGSR